MLPTIAVAPTEEPLSLADAKLHLRVTGSSEDALITSLIVTARERCEELSMQSLVTRTYDYYLHTWPARNAIALPMPPILSLVSLTYTTDTGATGTVPVESYYLAPQWERIVLQRGASWPTASLREYDAIKIRYTAGYGAASAVPSWAKHAMRLLIAHWFVNREEVTMGSVGHRIPEAAMSILMANRAY